MMKKLIEFELENGSILIEDSTIEREYERISKNSVPEKSIKSFDKAIADFEPAANSILTLIKKLSVTEGSVEMGLKFSAKAGIILASADSEATLKVILKWDNSSKSSN